MNHQFFLLVFLLFSSSASALVVDEEVGDPSTSSHLRSVKEEDLEERNLKKDDIFNNRIVGGDDAVAGEFPFMISLHMGNFRSPVICGMWIFV
mmetsp:Transcript_4873/g.5368  ORF Transcript_4873/g.5368 Transcript_4873/m.5368 type:complete len:93 (-) Transcript_4873:8-286(-)